MNIIFSDDDLPKYIIKSIFLAGPSPRNKNEYNWRKEALKILNDNNYTGTVFIPLKKDIFYGKNDDKEWNYQDQIKWECNCRKIADLVVYWIPRTEKMLGLTTNIEFGEDLNTKEVLYGRPDEALKCRYLDERIRLKRNKIYNNLSDLLNQAIDKLGEGAERKNGEINVPLNVWRTDIFKNWYNDLLLANNKLLDFKLNEVVYEKGENIFYFSAKVNVYIENEKREKSNESIFGRIELSSVVMYYKEKKDINIIIVKEFRSPVSNNTGYVYDLPGGSSHDKTKSALTVITEEIYEETGLKVLTNRLKFVSKRQLNGSTIMHKNNIFSLELTKEEFDEFKNKKGKISSYDGGKSGEVNIIEIVKLKELHKYPVDTNTVGAIFFALEKYILR